MGWYQEGNDILGSKLAGLMARALNLSCWGRGCTTELQRAREHCHYRKQGKYKICSESLWEGSSRNVICLKAQLKCFYTNALNLNRRSWKPQCAWKTITETWQYDSHNWDTTIEGYKLSRTGRQCRRGGRVGELSSMLKTNKQNWIDWEELPLRKTQKHVENLWVKVREET